MPEPLRAVAAGHRPGGIPARVAAWHERGWHYAPRSARESIERYGLDWRRSPRAREPQDPRNLAPVALYFSPDEETAREMGLDGDHDLYEVDLTGVPVTPDPYQPEDAFYTLEAIPPSRIRRA